MFICMYVYTHAHHVCEYVLIHLIIPLCIKNENTNTYIDMYTIKCVNIYIWRKYI